MCFFGKWLFLHVFCVDQHRLLVPVMARQMDQSLYSGVEVIVCNSMWLKLGHQEHLSTCWIGCCPMYKLLNKTMTSSKTSKQNWEMRALSIFFFFLNDAITGQLYPLCEVVEDISLGLFETISWSLWSLCH